MFSLCFSRIDTDLEKLVLELEAIFSVSNSKSIYIMVKYCHIFILTSLLISCQSQQCKSVLLSNTRTWIPLDCTECFKNKDYSKIILVEIDTESIYEETTQRTDGWYSVLKFYSNGYLNYFSFQDVTIYTKESFNSKINGLRGRITKNVKNSKNYIQTYCIINHSGDWGIKTEEIEVRGDEIHLISESGYVSVFKKKIVPKEFLSYDADW